MIIVLKEPFENGGYPSPQTWNSSNIPSTHAIIPDSLDMTAFYEHNGFVILTIENDTVTSYTPNLPAWEEWKASLPDPAEVEVEPTQLDLIEAQVTYTAMMTDTLLEV